VATLEEWLTSGPSTPDRPGERAADADRGPRPLVERLGLGAIALLLALVFGGLAFAALSSGEVFLGVMAGIGALMTVWVAGSSLRRG
jgi:hypothetical protein